jgi:hypothetical protein
MVTAEGSPGVSRFQAHRRTAAGVPLTVASAAPVLVIFSPGPPSTVNLPGEVLTRQAVPSASIATVRPGEPASASVK